MSSSVDDNIVSTCAACGKSGDGLKPCNACKLVKYCNAACKKKHRSKHKKKCQRRVAEMFDEALFKQPPPREECDICMLPLPMHPSDQKYQPCCGKMLCYGCIYSAYIADNRHLCPFCRTPEANSEGEAIERIKKRAEANDANAMRNLGGFFFEGMMGLPQDYDKGMELMLRAGELGCAEGYYNVGIACHNGEGVERDEKKAEYYSELAAMGGHVVARHNLGCMEGNAGNKDRALKHYMISAGAGYDNSLTQIRECFMDGQATKDDFENALRTHKAAKDEMKSDQRDAVAAYLLSRGRG